MSTQFPVNPTPARKSYDGYLAMAVDGTPSTVWAFPWESVQFNRDYNKWVGPLMDSVAYIVNQCPGLRMGALRLRTPVAPDRAFHTFLNTAFGPRTAGQLPPFVINFKEFAQDTVKGACGVWPASATFTAQFGTSGDQMRIFMDLACLVVDPDNVYNAPNLSLPSTSGTPGLGLASFSRFTLTDGTAPTAGTGGAGTQATQAGYYISSANVYDSPRSIAFSIDNGLTSIPAMLNESAMIGQGAGPWCARGQLAVTQNNGANNPMPTSNANQSFGIIMPTGDFSHALQILLTTTTMGDGYTMSPEQYVGLPHIYSLFGSNGGGSPTGSPLLCSYV